MRHIVLVITKKLNNQILKYGFTIETNYCPDIFFNYIFDRLWKTGYRNKTHKERLERFKSEKNCLSNYSILSEILNKKKS